MNVPEGTRGARHVLPDQLRGLALLGIVFVNMPYLAVSHVGLTAASVSSILDGVVAFLIVALAQGKFYLLFSFLFGYSLTLMLGSRAGDGLRRYRRRLVGLAVLGVLHATLFFIGDILLSYAVLGVALLWFAPRRTRTALRGALVAYGVGVAVFAALVLTAAGGHLGGGGFVDGGAAAALDAATRAGFVPAALARVEALPTVLVTLGVLNWSFALAMFLLGLVAGRLGVLARPRRYAALWRTLARWGLWVGLPGGLVSAWLTLFGPSPVWNVVGVALGFVTAPALTGGYVSLAARFSHTRVLGWTAPAGRMSLTGYLGESILLGLIFAGWGFGLYGRLSLAATAAVTLGVWLSLDLFSSWWLGRVRVGPFEWALRCWSNGRLEPPGRPSPPERRPQST